MANGSREALQEVLSSLTSRGMPGIATDISRVIARGVTRETEPLARTKELAQVPLEPNEAVFVAAKLLVAACEPFLLRSSAVGELSKVSGKDIEILWKDDFVENSPAAPSNAEVVSFPDLNPRELDAFHTDLKSLASLLLSGEYGKL